MELVEARDMHVKKNGNEIHKCTLPAPIYEELLHRDSSIQFHASLAHQYFVLQRVISTCTRK